MQTAAAIKANNSTSVTKTIKTTGAPGRTDIKMLIKIKQTRGQMNHTLRHLNCCVS